MLHLDIKYINLLSSQFEKFSRKGDYLFNVRCPICGDSQTKKTKMRGYLYRIKDRMKYKCHNCAASMGFNSLLKQMNPELYKEWVLEFLKEKRPLTKIQSTAPVNRQRIRFGTVDQVIYQEAEKISDLPDDHFCKRYIQKRKIPKQYWHKLYFSKSYPAFIKEIAPNNDKTLLDECRLVIPYYDAYGAVEAVTGRDLSGNPDTLRYITIRVDKNDTSKLVYGLERVDQSQPVIVVEGPFDSLFLNNAVASGDANLLLVAKQLSAKDVTLVYDNEPRNKEIVSQMTKAINQGYKVCVWPKWIVNKDINDMVLSGMFPVDIHKIIHDNTYSGISALVHLTSWKKV